MTEGEDLKFQALERIKYGENLINNLTHYHIDGILKIHFKIKQELKFLKKVCRNDTIKKEHLLSTGLTHFAAVLETFRYVNDCTNVCKSFTLNGRKLTVDIVCDGGLSWIKVITRNPIRLSQICMGDTNYGTRSILDHAEELVECASLHPTAFQTPKITFIFSNGIGKQLANKIESLGISVQGERLDLDEEIDCDNSRVLNLSSKNISNITKVNLDTSTMLVYCSSVTNGTCDKYDFSEPLLTQQAQWECSKPVKPILDKFFEGKKLYCCQTAKESFINILNNIGGPNEKIRGLQFLERITVLPDDATVSDTMASDDDPEVFKNVQYSRENLLEIGGRIKEKALKIFTFGDRIQAVTVTSNDAFVRTAKQKGVHFVVFVHESRALSEQKEAEATLRT